MPSLRADLKTLATIPRVVIGKLAQTWGNFAAQRGGSQEIGGFLPTPWGGNYGEANEWNTREALRSNTGHVFSAANFTANQVMALQKTTRLVAHTPRDETPTPALDHWLLDTLRNPNDLESGAELFGRTSLWLQLAGMAYWVKVRDRMGRIMALWPLLPDRTRVVIGTDVPIKGVNYFPDGFGSRGVGIAREDVVLFRARNPTGHVYGWPVLRAAAYEKEIGDKALRSRLAEFDNRCRPDYVLATAMPTGKERDGYMRRLMANLLSRHQGTDKTGLPLVVGPETKVFTLGFNAQEMEIIQQLNLTRDNIFEFFGVSSVLMGHFESIPARATLETELARYGMGTLEPMAELIWSTIQRDLVGPDVNGMQDAGTWLELARDTAVNEDRQFNRDTAIQGWNAGALTLNQTLELLNEEPALGPEGDQRKAPTSVPFAGAHISAGPDAAAGKEFVAVLAKLVEIERRMLAPARVEIDVTPRKRIKMVLDTEEKRAEFWKRAIAPQDSQTVRATRVISSFFRAQEKRVMPAVEAEISRLNGKYAGVARAKVLHEISEVIRKGGPMFMWSPDEVSKLADTLNPLVLKAAEAGGLQIADQIGFDWTLDSPRANAWLDKLAASDAAKIDDTTRSLISAVVRDGVADGQSTGEITSAARSLFAAWSGEGYVETGALPGYRAAMAARTTLASAFGYAKQEVLEEAMQDGAVENKIYISARDDLVRTPPKSEFDHDIDGEIVPIMAAFSNGLMFIGDPSQPIGNRANCRCTVAGA